MNYPKLRQTELIVDLNSIDRNIKTVKNIVGSNVEIMPIIKANAYGLGVEKIIEVMQDNNINIVGVAIVDEGIYLRKLGFKGDIFILNQPLEQEVESICENNLIAGVSSVEFIKEAGKINKELKIHIEVGTGMGRTGIDPYEIEKFVEIVNEYENIKIDGVYTHFSSSNYNIEYTEKQIEVFETALEYAKQLKNLRYIHACNSAGVLNFNSAHYNLVRPGLMIYGYLPSEELKGRNIVSPSCVLKSKISYIKEVETGASISYAGTFITKRRTLVATIPIGYADGVRRLLSNSGNVVINNKLYPIIGRICMDSFMVDVTDLEVPRVGEDVYIWDNKNITVEEVADRCNTINYEVLSTISERVVREYVRN